MSKGYASSYRIVLLSTGLFLCFGGLAARLVWLHVVNRDELLGTIKGVRRQLIDETAKRGTIYDARGVTLATSRSMRVLGVDPHALRPQDERKWRRLAQLIDLPEAELRRIFTTRFAVPPAAASVAAPAAAVPLFRLPGPAHDAGPEAEAAAPKPAVPAVAIASAVPAAAPSAADDIDWDGAPDAEGRRAIRWAKLRDEITEELYDEIMKLEVKGVYGQLTYRRAYPANQLAAHVIGFVNRAQEPASGIEAYADFYLRAQNGWRVGEKDGRGRELAQYRTRDVPRVDGFDVKLTLDLIVQDIVEQELAVIAEKFTPVKASIVVSDPRTGFILGMANYPSFNLNEYNKVPKEEEARMKNAAVADVYEPGSVFKIVAAAGALEERLVTPNHVFNCALEKIPHRGRMVDLPSEDHRMGELTVSEIISHSSNKGAAQLAVLLGEQRFHSYVTKFGFGRTLGFPIGGEVRGLLNPVHKWVPIDITRVAMGHTISSTVLQMHQGMSVIASGGMLLRPQIIREVTSPTGELVYRAAREELNRAVSPEAAQQVARMLMGVVGEGGTAKEAAIPGFDVAGKTGTTQKLLTDIRADGTKRHYYSNKHHVGSFVGFFPAGNPQVVISVIVDEAKVKSPSGVAYGRVVAAPSFKRIGERLIPVLEIKSHQAPAAPRLYAAQAGQGVRP
jgi:cell division protein FtsI/penicillin-binding protein 2